MIVGHFFLAFSVALILARLKNIEKKKAFLLGISAGLFALLPDLDMVLTLNELFLLFTSPEDFVKVFWKSSKAVHRGVSHSLVTSFLSVAGFAAYRRWKNYITALFVLSGLSAFSYLSSGLEVAFAMIAYTLFGLGITHKLEKKISLRELVTVSAIGLFSHPFGDIFTGTPPDFFFPLQISLIDSRIVLFSDPVLNLLSVFFLELLTIWFALILYFRTADRNLLSDIKPIAISGLIYFPTFYLISPPTLESSYQFVYSIISWSSAVTAVLYLKDFRKEEIEIRIIITLFLNLIAALTLASVSFTLVYLLG